MPLNYKKVKTGPTEKEFKNRNNTVRKVFNAKGIPRNMGNKEILSRVKVYNNFMAQYEHEISNDLKIHISDFITNGRVFNQRKRKALVDLMFRFKTIERIRGTLVLQILDLKNVDVINYIKYSADYFERWGGLKSWGDREIVQKFFHELTYKGWKGFFWNRYFWNRNSMTIREDPAAVRVLKKRTAFLKEMLKIDWPKNPRNKLYNLPQNVLNKFDKVLGFPYEGYGLHISDVWVYMLKEFPLPRHPKNAATKIQSAVRGMRNRKKLTTMRKAATTIQKTVRGMSTRKKMKTAAGRVSLRGKRKRSPQ